SALRPRGRRALCEDGAQRHRIRFDAGIWQGFDIMRNANSKMLAEKIQYNLDLGEIAELWRRGSVVSSWLLDLSAIALAQDPQLESYTGYVQDSGEGRWTIQ